MGHGLKKYLLQIESFIFILIKLQSWALNIETSVFVQLLIGAYRPLWQSHYGFAMMASFVFFVHMLMAPHLYEYIYVPLPERFM